MYKTTNENENGNGKKQNSNESNHLKFALNIYGLNGQQANLLFLFFYFFIFIYVAVHHLASGLSSDRIHYCSCFFFLFIFFSIQRKYSAVLNKFEFLYVKCKCAIQMNIYTIFEGK